MSNPYAPPPDEPARGRTGRDRHGAGTGDGAPTAAPGQPDHPPYPAPGAGNELLGAQRPDQEWPGPLLGPEAFGPQGPHGPGLLGPGLGQDAPPPPDPDEVRRADVRMLQFAALMFGAVLMSMLALPWSAGALLLLVVAMVAGVRALLSVRRARVGGGRTGMIVAGLVLSGMLSLSALGMVATWPLQMQLQECSGDALTVSAKAQCQQEFDEGFSDWQEKLLDQAAGTR